MKYITLMFMLLNLCYAVTNGKSLSDLPEDSIGQIAAYNSTLLVEVQTSDQPSNIYSAVFLTNDFIIFKLPDNFKFYSNIKLHLIDIATHQQYGVFTITQQPIILNNDYYVIKIPEELHKDKYITRSDLFLGEYSFKDLINTHKHSENQCSLLFVSPYTRTKNIKIQHILCSDLIYSIDSTVLYNHSFFQSLYDDLDDFDYNKHESTDAGDLYIPTFICVTTTCKLLGFYNGHTQVSRSDLTVEYLAATDNHLLHSIKIINFLSKRRELERKLNHDIPVIQVKATLHIYYDSGRVDQQIVVNGVLLTGNNTLLLAVYENKAIMPYISNDTLYKTRIKSLKIFTEEVKVLDIYVINKILYIKITVINKETSDQFVKAATKLVMHTNKYTPYLSDRDQIHVENINFRPLLMTIDNTSVITYFQSNPIKSSDKHVFTHTEILQ